MFVVKVGEHYVKSFGNGEIVLSKEIMRNFKESIATSIAEYLGGEVMEVIDEVTESS